MFRVIDNKNTKNFEHKKNRMLSVISKLIGRPNTKKLRYKRKFLVETSFFFNFFLNFYLIILDDGKFEIPPSIKTKIFTVEDTYLKEESVEDVIRIRKSVY